MNFFISTEKRGFEPRRGIHRLTDFESVPFSRTWVFLHCDIECRQEVLYNKTNENTSVFYKRSVLNGKEISSRNKFTRK